MPKFKSATSGVVVSVSDETAELIGSEWEPADDETAKSRTARTKKSE